MLLDLAGRGLGAGLHDEFKIEGREGVNQDTELCAGLAALQLGDGCLARMHKVTQSTLGEISLTTVAANSGPYLL